MSFHAYLNTIKSKTSKGPEDFRDNPKSAGTDPDLKIIVFSMFGDEEYYYKMIATKP